MTKKRNWIEEFAKLKGSANFGDEPVSEQTARTIVMAFERRQCQVKAGKLPSAIGDAAFMKWLNEFRPANKQ